MSSPVSRCGTTLVQRLLNSSRDVLVFGEGVGSGLIELSNALQGKASILERVEEHRRDLRRALDGEQFWYPHLMGDPAGFVALFADSLARFVRFHEQEARAHGRTRWGAKLPTVPIESLRGLMRSLPEARVLYIARDLVAAARSAKARRFLVAPDDFRRFARLWREGTIGSEEFRDDPQVLALSYEQLAQPGNAALAQLGAFVGVSDLDPTVLLARVNTWTGSEHRGHAPDQYLAPGELDQEELEILESDVRALTSG